MPKRKAGKKRAAKKGKVAGGKKGGTGGRKRRVGKKAATGRKRRTGKKAKKAGAKEAPPRLGQRSVQPRVWRRTARLAQDAQAALEAGDLAQVRQYLQSIRAVAECADRE